MSPPQDLCMNINLSRRQPPVPSATYGASRSILNWYGVRINAEDEWLNTSVLDPGWVQTDMGNSAAKGWGLDSAPDTIEKSTSNMVDVITRGTKEKNTVAGLCFTMVKSRNGNAIAFHRCNV